MNMSCIKKTISIAVVILTICLLVGCESTDFSGELSSSNMPNFQYMFKVIGEREPTQKSNSGYYNIVNNMIIYTDSDTLKSTPLCNKSDCLHTRGFIDCNSKIDDGLNCFNNLQIYKDKIYYIAIDLREDIEEEIYYLNSISLDGSEKNKVLTLKNKFIIDWFIYDDYFYYQASVVEQGLNSEGVYKNFYRINLSTMTEEVFIDFSKLKNIFGAEGIFRNVYDGYMYITLYGYTNEESYNKVISGQEIDSNDATVRKIMRYNLSNKSISIIDPYENDYEFIGFSRGKLVGTDVDGEYKKICLSELDGSNVETILEVEAAVQVFCDDNYIYIYNQPIVQANNEEKVISIYNKNGELISETYVPESIAEWLNNITLYDDYIWFKKYTDSGQGSLCVIEKSDLINNENELTYYEVYRCE